MRQQLAEKTDNDLKFHDDSPLITVGLRFLQIWRIKKLVCATLLPFEFSGATLADEAGEPKSGNI